MPYDVPDALVTAIIDAPPTPATALSPDGAWLLLVHYEAHPPISLLARPYRALGGLRIDPQHGLRRRTMLIKELSLVETGTGLTRQLDLPADASVSVPSWAADSRHFAFTLDAEDGLELCLGDVERGVHHVPAIRLTDMLTGGQLGGPAPFRWSRDSQSLLALTIPDGRRNPTGAEPEPAPTIQETAGKRTQMVTFADLLRSEADEADFETWATSQLVRVDAETLAAQPIGAPALIQDITSSPDGQHVLVDLLQRPFSLRVPFPYFARRTEVWSAEGIVQGVIADLPVSDEVPAHGVPTGPREVSWHEAAPATLWWVEALDGGDPRQEAEHRDRLMQLGAPFTAEPQEWVRLQHRCVGLSSLREQGAALVVEHDRDRRWLTTWQLHADDASRNHVVLERAMDDAYAHPGFEVVRRSPNGAACVVQDGDRVLVAGEGATPEGNRPFLGWLDLQTGTSERIFESADGGIDRFAGLIGDGVRQLLVRHESPAEVPNFQVVDLATGQRRELTDFPHPYPQLESATKRLITCDRGDGVQLSGMLHLPPGYDSADGPLPLVIWAYPDDFGTAGTAGQIRSAPGAFTQLSALGPVWFTLAGFAVLVDATMPVVGDPETMNDTFVEQITAAAKAHIHNLAAEGIVDPARVVAMGHSYGGFMTANLLAHTDLFAAGIARSGAYNRSLTPFGFQAERRHFWEARDIYDRLSPFRYADQISAPLLLIHGAADNNPGTYTIQSERLYAAIQATGGTARLVLLPHESHGYQARESVLHVLAEQFAWAKQHAG